MFLAAQLAPAPVQRESDKSNWPMCLVLKYCSSCPDAVAMQAD